MSRRDLAAVDRVELEQDVLVLHRRVERVGVVGEGRDVRAGLGERDCVSEQHQLFPSWYGGAGAAAVGPRSRRPAGWAGRDRSVEKSVAAVGLVHARRGQVAAAEVAAEPASSNASLRDRPCVDDSQQGPADLRPRWLRPPAGRLASALSRRRARRALSSIRARRAEPIGLRSSGRCDQPVDVRVRLPPPSPQRLRGLDSHAPRLRSSSYELQAHDSSEWTRPAAAQPADELRCTWLTETLTEAAHTAHGLGATPHARSEAAAPREQRGGRAQQALPGRLPQPGAAKQPRSPDRPARCP